MEQKTTATSGYADSASAYRASIEAAVRAVLTANKDGVLLRSVKSLTCMYTYITVIYDLHYNLCDLIISSSSINDL